MPRLQRSRMSNRLWEMLSKKIVFLFFSKQTPNRWPLFPPLLCVLDGIEVIEEMLHKFVCLGRAPRIELLLGLFQLDTKRPMQRFSQEIVPSMPVQQDKTGANPSPSKHQVRLEVEWRIGFVHHQFYFSVLFSATTGVGAEIN